MKVLAEYVNHCKNIVLETSSSEIVFTEEITTYVLESAKKIKTIAINLENNCENALKALYREKSQTNRVVQEDDNLQLLIDPADRPKLLTDLQKKKIIQTVHTNHSLNAIRKTQTSPKTNNVCFHQCGLENIHI